MDAALGDMVTAIENVVRGELACTPRVAATLFQRIGFPGFSAAAALAAAGRPVERGVASAGALILWIIAEHTLKG